MLADSNVFLRSSSCFFFWRTTSFILLLCLFVHDFFFFWLRFFQSFVFLKSIASCLSSDILSLRACLLFDVSIVTVPLRFNSLCALLASLIISLSEVSLVILEIILSVLSTASLDAI